MQLGDLRRRLVSLEKELAIAVDVYVLRSGERKTLRSNERLAAFLDALHGRPTERARLMLEAVSTSGGDRLFELCQALAAGPVPRGQVNDQD